MSEITVSRAGKSKDSWSVQTIADVCRLINGRAYKKNELLDEGPYRVLRVGNFFTNKNWYHSDLELDEDKYCDDGDLLYAWSASFGPRIWSGGKVIYHYHIWKVEPDPQLVERDYLFYFFEWDKELIREEQGAGATMIHVSKRSMEARAIPLPPLEEQKRIVAVLDQAFAALDRARALAEANLADAEELFENAAHIKLRPSNNDENWSIRRLGDVCTLQRGFDLPKRLRRPGRFPLVTSSGPTDTHAEAKVNGPGVVTGRSGSIGNVFYIEDDFWPLNTALYIKDFHGNAPKFVHHLLKDFDLSRYSSGAGVPTLNRNDVHDEMVAVPNSPNLQASISDALDQIAHGCERVSEFYLAKLSDLADLRQSLLQKAFAGELT